MRHDYGYEEEVLGKTYDARLIRRLLPLTGPYRGMLALSIVLVVLMAIVDLSLPYVTKVAIDRHIVPFARNETAETERHLAVELSSVQARAVVARHPDLFREHRGQTRIAVKDLQRLSPQERAHLRREDLRGALRAGLLLLLLAAVGFGLNFAQVMVMEYTGQMMMHDLRNRVYNHIQGLRVSYFNRNPVGRLVTRVTNDIGNMYELFTTVLVFVFKDVLLLAGIALILLWINWRLALATFAVLPLVLWASFVFSGRARGAYRTLRIKLAEINAHFSESIGGVTVLQVFGQEKGNHRKFDRINHENYLAEMHQIHLFAIFMPMIEMVAYTATAVIIYYGGRGILADSLSLGSLVAYISYMRMFFRPVRDMAEKYNLLQNAMASAERLFLILDNENSVPPPKTAARPARTDPTDRPLPQIEFERVSFAYVPGEPVLREVSLRVEPGEVLAVVGPTGSGKTSLIQLLLRFYDPSDGRIRFNGADIQEMPVTALRQKMATVMQEPFLFSQTIEKNIFGGGPLPSPEKIRDILRFSNCANLVNRLPEGLQTVLAEGGASISSGERQLICIARALARNPEVIILDEATSYVDAEAEHAVQEAVANLMHRRTTIVVAHRLTTAREADRIAVLHRGRIIEIGNHRELMERQGFYHKLYRYQTG